MNLDASGLFSNYYLTLSNHQTTPLTHNTLNNQNLQINKKTLVKSPTTKMQYSTILLSLLATVATAAPADPVSARADVKPWIIKSFTRTCNASDTSCVVKFGIDTQIAPVTNCQYTVTGNPASRTSANGVTCGAYTVSSGWSGQFGEGNGFTTWAVVDFGKKLITWPAYSDKEVVNGKAVVPDKAYVPANL